MRLWKKLDNRIRGVRKSLAARLDPGEDSARGRTFRSAVNDWPSDETTFAGRPPMGETGQTIHSIGPRTGGYWPLVTDDLIVVKGNAVYAKMRHDADVKSALHVKSCGVLSKGWEITCGIGEGDDGYEAASEQSNFVADCFNNMPGSLDKILKEILYDGLLYGTGIAEKNWALRGDGRLGFASIKPKDPTYYYCDLDDFSNLTGLWIRGLGGDIQLDPAKFARFTYQSERGQPWGMSDLRAAYKYWWAKDKVTQFWLIFLEKYGSPTAIGKYPRGTPKALQDQLLTVLNSIQQETAITIPDDQVVELLTVAGSGITGYQECLGWLGKQIAKAILGQTLTSDEGTRVGSLALGKVHQDVLDLYIKELKRQLEEFVDEELVRPLVDLNFAERYYPNFVLMLDDTDIAELSEVFYRLAQVDIVDAEIDRPMIWERLGFPARTQEQEAMVEERKAEAQNNLAGLGVGENQPNQTPTNLP